MFPTSQETNSIFTSELFDKYSKFETGTGIDIDRVRGNGAF